MGIGPIPTSAILDYCELLHLDQHETFEMIRVIRAVDNGYLTVVGKNRDGGSK